MPYIKLISKYTEILSLHLYLRYMEAMFETYLAAYNHAQGRKTGHHISCGILCNNRLISIFCNTTDGHAEMNAVQWIEKYCEKGASGDKRYL
jgi:hypothetical protein